MDRGDLAAGHPLETCLADMTNSAQLAVRRALFVIPTLTGGGSERVVTNLLKYLDRRRFRLTLAVVDMRQAEFLSDVPEDVEVVDLRCLRVRYALPKLIAMIWRLRPDVVFSTLGHLNLALAILATVASRWCLLCCTGIEHRQRGQQALILSGVPGLGLSDVLLPV